MNSLELDHHISFLTKNFSNGVDREILAVQNTAQNDLQRTQGCKSATEFCESGLSSAPKEYSLLIQDLGKNLKILDVGVGAGQSAAFLANNGHQVWAVEPSPDFCRVLSFVKIKFNLNLHPVCSVGEDLDKLSEKNFDAVFFNSSLHHCDDPIISLKNAYALLKPGGVIFLSAESFLRPWVKKKKWYQRLETHPEEMGHYGGNEHAYYTWEYKSMLREAGFSDVKMLPSAQFLEPLFRIQFEFKSRNGMGRTKMGESEFLIRTLYYFLMARIVRISFFYRLLSQFSLLPGQVKGIKKA